MGRGQELYKKARLLIPGGTQLLSKRPEMFLPERWPAYYSRAKGVEVWDLDNRCYLDMTHCGVGTSPLGFADSDVDAAVVDAALGGNMATLNCAEEVELAELLIDLHPWAHMVRFARCGGEIMAIAIRIARAATGREKVAVCGYHGWHDWYLASNIGDTTALDGHLLPGLQPAGVPRALRGSVLPFRYNEVQDLEEILVEHGPELAAIVMEPVRSEQPKDGFLQDVRNIASGSGAVLVFDEVTSGWRMNTGGIHLTFGVEPDMAAFAKGMSNGYPMAALVGKKSVMEAAQRSFISSTYWTDRIGPAAAVATIRKHGAEHVGQHLIEVGTAVQNAWREAACSAGIVVTIRGIPPLSHLSIEGELGSVLSTLFTQEMLDRGILAGTSFYPTFAHKEEHVQAYRDACFKIFETMAASVRTGDPRERLRGPVRHEGFQRLA